MATFTYTMDQSFLIAPADSQVRAQGAARIRETRLTLQERLAISHYAAGDQYDGKEKAGSAIAYYQAVAPTTHPDGDALGNDVYSKGKIWINSDNGAIYYWNGTTVASPRVQGLGSIDLEAWHANAAAIEGYRSALEMATSADDIALVSNAYYDGAWKYKAAGAASMLQLDGGTATICYAVPGSANAAITWISVFVTDAHGQLAHFKGVVPTGSYHNNGTSTYGDIYTALAADLPDNGSMLVTGAMSVGVAVLTASYATRSGTTITLYGWQADTATSVTLASGGTPTSIAVSLAW